MKYADGPTTSASIIIHAPIGDVWAIVSDIESPTRFSTELTGVEWLDPATAEPALGARFVGRSTHDAIGTWQTTCEITGLEPERLFEWSVVGGDDVVSSVWRFVITERPHDGIELQQWFRMGPGRSGLNGAIDRMPDKEDRIVARRLEEHRTNIERTLAGIKATAERGREEHTG